LTERLAIDSSAVIAILNREAEAQAFAKACAESRVTIGFPTLLEVRLWVLRRPMIHTSWLETFLTGDSLDAIAFGSHHERLATSALERFGRGRHPAGLNFGDCMAYAVAAAEGLPLLFKGSDFAQTDVAIHPASVAL
jgi:ribonuclease VapC